MKPYKILLSLLAVACVLFSCSKNNDPFPTAGENDFPRILNTDIPEGSKGKVPSLPSVFRDTNFKFKVLVTPTQYTTVSWVLDQDTILHCDSIDQKFPAGEYEMKIVARTTKGKETSRTCSLSVKPCEGDPSIYDSPRNRHLQIGAQHTMLVENLQSADAVYVGKKKADGVSFVDGDLTFTVPEVDVPVTPEQNSKKYNVFVECEGVLYGLGLFNVSHDEYVDPGEKTLWSGDQVINWGESNVALNVDDYGIEAGMQLTFQIEMIDAEYHCFRIATGPSWAGDVLPQFDLNPDQTEVVMTVTQQMIDNARADGGEFLIVGFGYKLKKVLSYMPEETVLWKGEPVEINWGESNILLEPGEMEAVPVGKTIRIYYDVPEAEYHAMRITGPWWDADLVPQFDITADTPNPYEFKYTDEGKAIVDAQGGMLVVGFGYTVTKITFK